MGSSPRPNSTRRLSTALTAACLVAAALLGFMGAFVTAPAATTMAGESVTGSPNLTGGILPPTHATCNGSVVNIGYQVINQPATGPAPGFVNEFGSITISGGAVTAWTVTGWSVSATAGGESYENGTISLGLNSGTGNVTCSSTGGSGTVSATVVYSVSGSFLDSGLATITMSFDTGSRTGTFNERFLGDFNTITGSPTVGLQNPANPGITPVLVSFTSVTVPGITAMTVTSTGPPPPSGFTLATPPTYYNISTTAVVYATAAVCITDAAVTPGSVLLHFDSSGNATEVTASGYPISTTICGVPVTSLGTFAIAHRGSAPSFTSAATTTFTVGQAGSFTVTATGPPAPSLSQSGALPAGVTFDAATGVLSGMPGPGTVGTYPVTFTASNGVPPDAVQGFTLTVTGTAPTITSATTTTFTVGQAGSFTVTATGVPAPTLSESGPLPSGVTFAPGTGLLSGTPGPGSQGSYPVTFTATNGVAPDATQRFTLTVNALGSAPVFTSAAHAQFTEGQAGSFTVTATGMPAATFGASGSLPAGVTFDAVTGVLSGTPAAGTRGVYPLTLAAHNGIPPDSLQAFTLVVIAPGAQPPVVTGVSPNFGPQAGGQTVRLGGFRFTGARAVLFGAVPASSFTVDSDSQITAITPAQAGIGAVDVTVTASLLTSATGLQDRYFYLNVPKPAVTRVLPGSGPWFGGNRVLIAGTSFTGASDVKFGNVPASSFTVNSATQITAIAPAVPRPLTSTRVDVTVITPGGSSAVGPADRYGFANVAPPNVIAVSPTTGPVFGGNQVVILGSGLFGATAVDFGGRAASFAVDSDTRITVTPPPAAMPITVDVTVRTPAGASPTSAAGRYSYADLPPAVSSVSPHSGPALGHNTVVILGTNFFGVTGVDFGHTAALSFTVDSPTRVSAVAPPGTGAVDVTITTPASTSAVGTADRYSYASVPPLINALAPGGGPTFGGNQVRITGRFFFGATSVRFGTTAARSFTVDSDTQITATAPPGTGRVQVSVTTPDGTGTAPYVFANLSPAITRLTPSRGPLAGGSQVLISGHNFFGVTAVEFGTRAATSFTVDSPTLITAIAPPGTGIVDVAVVTLGGSSPRVFPDRYTYANRPPIVSRVAPVSGPVVGGNQVVLTGSDFFGITDVRFGAVQAVFTVDSASRITAIAPPGTGTVSVEVTSQFGTSRPLPYSYR